MARPGDQGHGGGRARSARPRRVASAENLASSTPASDQHRHGRASPSRSHSGSWVPVPARRRLEASPAAVFASRSSRAARRSSRPAKRGWASHSSRNASTPTSSRWSARRSSASRRRARSLGVVDAARRADQHQAPDQVRAVPGRDAGPGDRPSSTRRRWPPAGRPEQARPLHEVGPHRRRPAVAGRVHQDHLVVPCQVVGERAPATSGLGEAVHQHQPVPVPGDLGAEPRAGRPSAGSVGARRSPRS